MTDFSTGREINGFKVQYNKKLTEYNSRLIKICHKATGLEIVHIFNDDNENLFAYIFRTPVSNNKGIPHILEHSTLCGSRSFPLKDPFVILMKGSMNTFLNAFTTPDSTIYLASSTIPGDFYNLMLVYGDAVFNPLLKKEAFQQEGFHYEVKNNGDIQIVGIVYNEMKGNYSNAESLVHEWTVRSLFPANTYGYDSGGDPQAIPGLTYREYLDYYKKYYHPTNCRIFFYGNIETEKHLEFLNTHFLDKYTDKLKLDSAIRDHKHWKNPREVKIAFPVKSDSSLTGKSSIILNWLTSPVSDPFELLKLELLSEILLGNAGSPLRKALVESHIGEDLSPASGLETGLKESVFSTGIRGTEVDRAKDVIDCIFTTLNSILDTGLDDKIIMAALHRIEFRKRELHSGNPYGISLLFKTLRGWIHDLEPEITLEYDNWLMRLKQLVNEDKVFYKALIRKYLISNSHRSTVIVYPDPGKEARDRDKMEADLKKIKANSRKVRTIKEDCGRLAAFQANWEAPADIARIPSLNREDLPAAVTHIPFEQINFAGNALLYFHDIHTNNIIYLDFAFDLGNLDNSYCSYLPLFGKMLLGCRLPGLSYADVATLISLYLGGITSSLVVETTIDGHRKLYLILSIRFLADRLENALDIFCRLLLEADFSDKSRSKDIFIELRNKYKSSIIPNGNFYTSLRAAAGLSGTLKIEEQWYGIEQFFFLNDRIAHLDGEMDATIEQFNEIKRQIFTLDGLLVNVCCDEENFGIVRNALINKITGCLPAGKPNTRHWPEDVLHDRPYPLESIVTSSSVNFVGRAIKGARIGSDENAIESVLTHLLNTGYLWDTIRVQGGAYGAGASSYGLQGIYTFASYRDPHIIRTLDAFKQSLEYIRDGHINPEQLNLAVIGTVGKHEKPLRGAHRGYINFKRIICGITDDIRQRQRDLILHVKTEQLRECASLLLKKYEEGVSVILTNRGELEKASKENPALPGKILEVPV